MYNATLEAALKYAELGYKVFPCKPGEKKPLRSGWQESATCDPSKLEDMFSTPGLNIGWAVPENMMVLDIDQKAGIDGFSSLEALEKRYGSLQQGPNQETPSGGNHLVFSLPEGVTVPNSVGKIGQGLDIRSSGGYIVVAPSIVNGKEYQWGNDAPWRVKTPPAPPWLIDLAIHGKKASPIASAVFGQGERNSGLASIAGSMRKRGMSQGAIYAALIEENKTRCAPPLSESEVRVIAESIAGYAPSSEITPARQVSDWREAIEAAEGPDQVVEVCRLMSGDGLLSATAKESLLKAAARAAGVRVGVLKGELGAAAPATAGEMLPSVDVTRSDFAKVVDDAARVLGGIPEVYQRGGELVEVIARPDRGDVMIQPIAASRLTYLLARGCRWRHGDQGDGMPPENVVASLMAAGYWPNVRPLAGLLYQPTIGQGGRIVGDGYDAETMRLGVFDAARFPVYEGTAAEGLAELRALLAGFAWASPLDESAAVGAALTAVLRPALPTAPAFLVTAPDLGSGKTYLAQVIGQFAGGAMLRRWPRQEDECAKALFAALLEGRPAVLFDNLVHNWASESLAAALTSPTYAERTMATHRSVEVSTACLILAGGNNVRAVADLARRVVTIRLDARVECPASRQFSSDPLNEVTLNRGRWVMLALKIVQGWIEAGRPVAKVPVVGSFGTWSDLVRQPLILLGMPDPAAPLLSGMGDDPDREMLERLLVSMAAVFGSDAVSTREIVKFASLGSDGSDFGAIRDVLETVAAERGEIVPLKVGRWLGHQVGRVVGGLRLEQGERGKHGHPWRVVSV